MSRASPGNWSGDKVQFCGCGVDRFEPRAARSRWTARRRAAARASSSAGSATPMRTGRLRPGERLPSTPRAGPRPGRLARAGGAVLRPAARRGLPGRPSRVGDPGRRRRPGRPRRRARRRRRAPRPAVDFVPAVPDLAGFPRDDWAWAVREASRDGAERRVRLPASPPGRCGCGRCWPATSTECAARPPTRPDRHLHRLLPGPGARAAGAGRARGHAGRLRGPGLRRDRAHRRCGGRRERGAGAGRRARRRRRLRWPRPGSGRWC